MNSAFSDWLEVNYPTSWKHWELVDSERKNEMYEDFKIYAWLQVRGKKC